MLGKIEGRRRRGRQRTRWLDGITDSMDVEMVYTWTGDWIKVCPFAFLKGNFVVNLNISLLLHVRSIGRRRQWYPTPVLLPGKSHGWRSLVGCSPWGREELDMTERLHFHFSLLCIGDGNGNPLQCSCLENPRDGVAQNRTRLK
ncbi:unnamed protein product [Rangifer tarandus platyrhynchus]|uniref:Uncharacterized protein n=1 Tax=Rangifer tarandus platyrhynchus TaxID=3082113 RepID=A0ABN9A6M3_RANTA|nr:unnamed protein product [Rangifer tarandus platyrhynchus]